MWKKIIGSSVLLLAISAGTYASWAAKKVEKKNVLYTNKPNIVIKDNTTLTANTVGTIPNAATEVEVVGSGPTPLWYSIKNGNVTGFVAMRNLAVQPPKPIYTVQNGQVSPVSTEAYVGSSAAAKALGGAALAYAQNGDSQADVAAKLYAAERLAQAARAAQHAAEVQQGGGQ